ncbi:PREDICTED: major royal jelly protein 1 [Dufourea novaeangliae]|uniref:Major royal jelly protein 1 n=1 Tax=Dufourea novaeangliae TaxID=178035 RepID=A0A154P8Q9_DUFNO|nr:PREDICTED: major royal jelly protein 1 [Dufourea novaeangliae]XP_015430006.1 PREDICTED: major royal jelly protein 1 [Dufourea novaeangliae]KZC08252.1 Major royal jelly protein 1 [Dufourea novaeangliae]
MKWFLSVCLLTVLSVAHANQSLRDLSVTLSGRSLEWPCQSTKNIYETSGRYITKNVIATRMQVYKDQAILAMPRYKPGVPFTLGVVSLKSTDCSPKVAPFPCWAIQEEGNCQALQSVVDIVLDMQDVLWVLDVGIVNTLEQPVRRCPPKVVGIDVKSGKVVKVIDLSTLTDVSSRLQYLAVDYAEDGQVYVYVSDAATRAIIVYNVTADRGYRVVLPRAVVKSAEKKDALYLSLIRKSCGTQVLYFSYLGSSRIFAIKATNLRAGNPNGSVVEVGLKKNKIVILGTDNGSAIFFRMKGDSDVYMWNTETPFVRDNFLLVQKGSEYRLPTQVVPGYKRLMWVIESNFHDYISNAVSCSGASVSLHPLMNSCDDQY